MLVISKSHHELIQKHSSTLHTRHAATVNLLVCSVYHYYFQVCSFILTKFYFQVCCVLITIITIFKCVMFLYHCSCQVCSVYLLLFSRQFHTTLKSSVSYLSSIIIINSSVLYLLLIIIDFKSAVFYMYI